MATRAFGTEGGKISATAGSRQAIYTEGRTNNGLDIRQQKVTRAIIGSLRAMVPGLSMAETSGGRGPSDEGPLQRRAGFWVVRGQPCAVALGGTSNSLVVKSAPPRTDLDSGPQLIQAGRRTRVSRAITCGRNSAAEPLAAKDDPPGGIAAQSCVDARRFTRTEDDPIALAAQAVKQCGQKSGI